MILVTGATGLVGSHLVCSLTAQDHKVRAIYRDEASLEKFKMVAARYSKAQLDKVEWLEADLLDLISLEDACQGITTIYHAAAFISFDPRDQRKLRKINIEGTANLVNVALSKGVTKICHISSVATLGKALAGQAITEETEWNPQQPGSGYAISKYGAEMEIWRGGQEGLKVCMLLPSVILGEGHWNSASGNLIKKGANGMPFYTPGGSGFVDVQDVVQAAILIANSAACEGEKFLLSAYNKDYKSFFTNLAIAFGSSKPRYEVPQWCMRIAASTDWLASRILGTPQRLSQALVDSIYKQSNYSSDKIKEKLDFEFTPWEQTIERICDAFKAQNHF